MRESVSNVGRTMDVWNRVEEAVGTQPSAVVADTMRMALPRVTVPCDDFGVAHSFCAAAAWACAAGDPHWWDQLEEVTLVLIEVAERSGHAIEMIEVWSGTAAAAGRWSGPAARPS